MKILFAALHHGYFRNLESVVEELARRGHQVHLASERAESVGGRAIVDRLAAAHPNVTVGSVPGREDDDAAFLSSKVRLGLDYLRYIDPPYDQTPALRRRAEVRTPRGIVRLSQAPLFSSRVARRLTARALDAVDHAVPRSSAIDRFIRDSAADVVIITPLVGVVASSQLDLLRSAIAQGLPTGLCVWSWDHLSSKAIIRDLPARLFVWNETQQREAIEMHRVPAERIVVTGAQCFDRWFGRSPSRPRGEFARRVGLVDERPYVLWVCSALFPGSPSEAEFVMRWIAHLRASGDPRVRDAAVLIRPHPSRASEWDDIDWRAVPGVALWGGNPIDDGSRNDYFDSLHYSAAVAGLNTSAFIEAGIADRPVMAILPPEFRANQEGTLHFRYLMEVGGGLLTIARSLDEHERQLQAILAGDDAAILERQRQFVRAFVRPNGLDVAATPVLADAIEQLQRQAVTAPVRPASAAAAMALRLIEAMQRSGRGRTLLLDERETRSAASYEDKRRRTAESLARKAAERAEKAARRARRAS